MIDWLVAFLLGAWLGGGSPSAPTTAAAVLPLPSPARINELDRIAFAVEGAESSHGRDPAMWQPNWHGPQGPMQVTHAAAVDVGGGNRFDPDENRLVGRAYLAAMFRRYGNWTDAVAAYNWGPANVDHWIAAGRPIEAVSAPIRAYVERIMRDFLGETAIAAASLPGPPKPKRVLARSVFPPVPPTPEPVPPRDPALRKRFEANADAIQQLREFIAGDDGTAAAARATMRAVAARRGYEQFQGLGRTRVPAASPTAMRDIAHVLIAKLQSENAAIALIDERRRGKPR